MVVMTGTAIPVSPTQSANRASPTWYELPDFAVDVTGQLIGKVVGPCRAGSRSQCAWIAIETGLIARRVKMAPLAACRADGTDIVVPWSREMVRRSPRIAFDREGRIAASTEQRLSEYYGSAH